MSEFELMRLVGGDNDGRSVPVVRGLPFLRMPKRAPLPTIIFNSNNEPVPVSDDVYLRLRVGLPGRESFEVFALEGMPHDDVIKNLLAQ
jgi:hypothetical protein